MAKKDNGIDFGEELKKMVMGVQEIQRVEYEGMRNMLAEKMETPTKAVKEFETFLVEQRGKYGDTFIEFEYKGDKKIFIVSLRGWSKGPSHLYIRAEGRGLSLAAAIIQAFARFQEDEQTAEAATGLND